MPSHVSPPAIHTTSGNSGSYNGIFSGRGTLNVTATSGAGGWTLASTDLANNNAVQRGELNVLGGQVTLNDSRGGALGDTVHVHVGAAGTLAVALIETVGSLSGAGTVDITAPLPDHMLKSFATLGFDANRFEEGQG